MNNKETKKSIAPSEYFEHLKGAKNTITTEALKESYAVILGLAEKYVRVGQVESLKKLTYLATILKEEEKLIDLGITTFVYKDVIQDYINHVADKVVKIIELSRYTREIPNELVETVEKTKDIFDEFYVVFTDYTGKIERQVKEEKRQKDPILFGTFTDGVCISDRFYFLGDWVDEYCDLTLDKMVAQYKEKKGYTPISTISVPSNTDELIELMKSYKIEQKNPRNRTLDIGGNEIGISDFRIDGNPQKKGFFSKVRSIFSKK